MTLGSMAVIGLLISSVVAGWLSFKATRRLWKAAFGFAVAFSIQLAICFVVTVLVAQFGVFQSRAHAMQTILPYALIVATGLFWLQLFIGSRRSS
jgi:hypothetical protein